MEKIELLKGDFASQLSLALAPTIKAGFPSPADDYLHDSLDFNRDLIKNPEATFYGHVSGDSMIEGYVELLPANPAYSPIRIDADDNFRVWGVVVWTIKQWRR